jgi:hypothetical protein
MSNLRFHKFINSEYRRKFENVKIEYEKLMLLDDVRITRKVDSMVRIFDEIEGNGINIYGKKEILEKFEDE